MHDCWSCTQHCNMTIQDEHHIIWIQKDKLDAQRSLFCNSVPYGELHIVHPILTNLMLEIVLGDEIWIIGKLPLSLLLQNDHVSAFN